MVLKNLLAGVVGLFLFISIQAFGNKDLFSAIQPGFSDSTGTDDSLKQEILAKDSKQEFRDLLLPASPDGMATGDFAPEIRGFIDDYAGKNGKKLEQIRDRSGRYFDIMDGIFEQYNLPKELKYLAIVESELKMNARSRVGAVGPWQFMPATARHLGLKVNKKYDERQDFIKSTHAACKYLANLYSLYEDWLLVIAAYNSGPGKVNSAIKRSGSHDYWKLQRYLPAESKSHVKKFIATHYFLEGLGADEIAQNTGGQNEEDINNTGKNSAETPEEPAPLQISGRYLSFVIMKHISMDIASFNKLNPGFDKEIGTLGIYSLRLPADKIDLFLSKKQEILNESLQVLLKQAGGTTAETTRL